MTNRREFIVNCSFGASAAAAALALTSSNALAQGAMVAETDANAVSLGYKALATKVDKKKYPKYATGQVCSNCALYQGKAADKAGGCPLFAGKQVAGPGWCSAWAKKA
jgi:High potential iron-sulfur protein